MKSFVPKVNEKVKLPKSKTHLEKGTYLFTQKIINGKDLDILIVKIDKDNNSEIIGIQITIHKPPEDIFTISNLKTTLDLLEKNLKKFYDFEIDIENKMYFTYIFDKKYQTSEKDKFKKMIDRCEENKIPYILFDPEEINFYNKNNEIIKFLAENVCCPFQERTGQKRFICDDDEKDIVFSLLEMKKKKISTSYNYISESFINSAIKILWNDYENGDKIKTINYIRTISTQDKNQFLKNKIYFGRTKKCCRVFMIYFSRIKKKNISVFLDIFAKPEENLTDIGDINTYYDEYDVIYK